jgi:hypothetical protein
MVRRELALVLTQIGIKGEDGEEGVSINLLGTSLDRKRALVLTYFGTRKIGLGIKVIRVLGMDRFAHALAFCRIRSLFCFSPTL